MIYELYYWPGLQGRGEYVRLALEAARAEYVDIALLPESEGGGVPALQRFLGGADVERPPFAPPFLKAGDRMIGQTANILLYLGGRLGLAPSDEDGRSWAHQLQLTIADFIAEIHDTHHPIASGLYYEDQKHEAQRRTRDFLDNRLPKFLNYFATVLERNSARSGWLIGASLTYPDLSLAQTIAGLRYAFPRRASAEIDRRPALAALHDEAFGQPALTQYFASGRRVPFNEYGLFRCYPELDA